MAAIGLDPRVTPSIEAPAADQEPATHALAVTADGNGLRFGFEAFLEPSTRAGRRFARPAGGAEVIGVATVTGRETLIAATRQGRAMLCPVGEVNFLSGAGRGVRVVKLDAADDRVVGFIASHGDRDLLSVETSRGAVQTVSTAKYTVTGRGGRGRVLLQRGRFGRRRPATGDPAGARLARREVMSARPAGGEAAARTGREREPHGAMSIDRIIDAAMRPVADAVAGVVFVTVPVLGAELPLIVGWLVGGGAFFTLYLRFINVRGFVEALRIVSGRRAGPADPGEIPQFQALTTAVSGTVGIGNIAGVAVAISAGGPGATFWLIVAGLLGMSTKFAECTLGVRFRRDNPDGSVSGGPMYYLERGLRARGLPRLGQALGVFYAGAMMVGCLGIGNMFQSNQAAALFIDVTGGETGYFGDKAWLIGLLLAVLVALVIVGGIRSIARTTVRLVPSMALLYVALALTRHRPQRARDPGRPRLHLARGVRTRGHRRRRPGRPGDRLPARRLLERGGPRERGHRACHGANRPARQRRLRGPARAVPRYRRHLHDDRPRHHHDGLRPVSRRGGGGTASS